MLKTQIVWSKKLIEKFGNTLFPELAKRKRTTKKFYKMKTIDNFRTDVNEWLRQQLKGDFIKQVVSDNGWDASKQGNDYTIHQILKWVKNNITYQSDMKVHNQIEYWQTSEETLKLSTGDCEDGAILILTLAYHSKIDMALTDLTWGSVIGGGHAYIVYTREEDAVEVILDWCYWYTSIIVKLRKWFHIEEKYLTVWGTGWI